MSNAHRTSQANGLKAAVLAVCCALALGACGSSPPVRYFTLQGPATTGDSGAASTAAIAARSVQLVGLALPEAIDRPQLVSRSGNNTLNVHEHARWADPLKPAFSMVFASAMRNALGGAPVVVRAGGLEDTAWKLSIDVQRFDAQPGRDMVLDAVWSLRGAGAATTLTRASVVREPANGDTLEAMVAAQSRAVAALAREIAHEVDAQVRAAQRTGPATAR